MKSVVWITLVSVSISACAAQGDFGRTPSSTLDDKIIPTVQKVLTQQRNKPVSWYPQTPEERRMRISSASLITPHGKPEFLEKTIVRIERANLVERKIIWNSPERYLARLKREKFNNGPNRVAYIQTHIREDSRQFRIFKTHVDHVFQADKKRIGTLRRMFDAYPADEDNTHGRVTENRKVVLNTLSALDLRLRGYDKALRRTQLHYPNARIHGAGEMLINLKSQVDSFAAEYRPYIEREKFTPRDGPTVL